MTRIFAAAWVVVFSLSALANNKTAPFIERFEITYVDGQADTIRLREGIKSITLEPILAEIRRDIESLQNRPFNEVDILESTFGADEVSTWSKKDRKTARKALEALKKIDVRKVFENRKLKAFVKKFTDKLKQHLIGHNIMANMGDPAFFYSRAVTYQAVTWGLNFARKFFDNVPILNIASFIIQRAEKMVRDRRFFHQNMILHYLENAEAKQLGLAEADVDLVRSSIYEARIPWFAFWESNAARDMWETYGDFHFKTAYSAADDRYLDHKDKYSKAGARLNFAFMNVEENGKRMIVNLVNPTSMLDKKPSVAYDYDNPKAVADQRRLLRLVQMGSRLINMPALARNLFDKFMNSLYVQQTITEGALFGYLESEGMLDDAVEVAHQSINPFLVSELY